MFRRRRESVLQNFIYFFKGKQSLLRIYIEREMNRTSGRLGKEKTMSLVFAWGWGLLLAIVVWCACPLRHLGTGQNKSRA